MSTDISISKLKEKKREAEMKILHEIRELQNHGVAVRSVALHRTVSIHSELKVATVKLVLEII